MQIFSLGWLGLPIGVLLILKKYYLHSGELWLLFYANLLLLSTLFSNWIMQVTHLIIVTAISTHVLSICKQTSGSMSQKKYNLIVRIFLHLEEEFSIFVYAIAAWLFLRAYTDKTASFGIGTKLQLGHIFMGVDSTLSGWNCTQLEFVVIPFIWLTFNLLSYLIGNLIIGVEKDKDNLYKEYVLKYKVVPDFFFSLITFLYNLYSYKHSQTLFQCCDFWEYGYLMKISVYLGFASSTFYFFFVKKGVFLIEGNENNSDGPEHKKNEDFELETFK